MCSQGLKEIKLFRNKILTSHNRCNAYHQHDQIVSTKSILISSSCTNLHIMAFHKKELWSE